jgi:hypothetical protein
MTSRKIEENLGLLSDLQSFDKNAFIGNDDFSQDMCNLILAFAPIWNDNKSFSLYSDQIETAKPTDVKIENPQNVVWNRHGEK